MSSCSPILDAAVLALRGEPNVDAVWTVWDDEDLSAVIALAPTTHPIVRSVTALFGRLPALIDEPTLADPAFHDSVARMIGPNENRIGLNVFAQIGSERVDLDMLAQIAPAGWGQPHIEAILAVAQKNRCNHGAAAALIGPCNDAAALLNSTKDIAFALRRWGQSISDAPTAWMHALSAQERNRLFNELRRYSYDAARCLPWLPPDRAKKMAKIDDAFITNALSAFADASPTARTMHADLLQHLIAHASPRNIGALTLLASAMKSAEVWDRVQTLIKVSPEDAGRVTAAPWRDLPEEVRNVAAELNLVIGAAQGRHDKMLENISYETAVVFFAALDPRVWDALDSKTRSRWIQALGWEPHLAVQSLGLRPEILVQMEIKNDLVRAAQRHARDDVALRNALFPVALRRITPNRAHALIAALPMMPSDPGVVFGIASRHSNANTIPPAEAALHTPADLALAVLLQRSIDRGDSVIARCTALQQALRGRTWNDVQPIMSLLDANTRARIPIADSQVKRLAHPDRKEEMRQALSRLASLPPEVAIPTLVALNWQYSWETPDAAKVIADALREHGDVFLALTDACGDDRWRTALLPLPKRPLLADALRALAYDDPPSAQRLARAVHERQWPDAIDALLAAPPQHTDRIWRALHPSTRESIRKTLALAAPKEGPIADVLQAVARRDLLAALALEAVIQSDNADLRNAGCATLSLRPDILRTIWTQLPQDARRALRAHPSTAVVVADISDEATVTYTRHRRFR